MERLDRQIVDMEDLFLDHPGLKIDNGQVVKVDNPGQGACFFTSVVNYLRIEHFVKKHLYKKQKIDIIDDIYIPYLNGNSIKFGGNTLIEDAKLLREMVCNWLSVNKDTVFMRDDLGVKTFKEFLTDRDEDDPFLSNFLTKRELRTLSDDQKYTKYIKYMRNYGSYSGPMEAHAIGRILNRNLTIFAQGKHRGVDHHYYYSTSVGLGVPEYRDKPAIGVYHTMGRNHYKTLYPKYPCISNKDIVISGMKKK